MTVHHHLHQHRISKTAFRDKNKQMTRFMMMISTTIFRVAASKYFILCLKLRAQFQRYYGALSLGKSDAVLPRGGDVL